MRNIVRDSVVSIDQACCSYTKDKLLTGVLFLHDIAANRMDEARLNSYKLFRKICGDEAMKHVIIVTTMWDTVSPNKGESRLQELQNEYFSDAMRHGVRVMRHNNTDESAINVLVQLLGKDVKPRALRIQREMVDYRSQVVDTGAGKELMNQLGAEAKKLEKDASEKEREERRLEEELKLAHEGLSSLGVEREELKEDIRRLRAALEKVKKERNNLKKALDDTLRARVQALIAQILSTNSVTQVQVPVSVILCCPSAYTDRHNSPHRTKMTQVRSMNVLMMTEVDRMMPHSLRASVTALARVRSRDVRPIAYTGCHGSHCSPLSAPAAGECFTSRGSRKRDRKNGAHEPPCAHGCSECARLPDAQQFVWLYAVRPRCAVRWI